MKSNFLLQNILLETRNLFNPTEEPTENTSTNCGDPKLYNSQLHVFFFRVSMKEWTEDEIKKWLSALSLYYVFQGQKAHEQIQYDHWQGRIWNIGKVRLSTLMNEFNKARIDPESVLFKKTLQYFQPVPKNALVKPGAREKIGPNKIAQGYAEKSDTRIKGPFYSQALEDAIPDAEKEKEVGQLKIADGVIDLWTIKNRNPLQRALDFLIENQKIREILILVDKIESSGKSNWAIDLLIRYPKRVFIIPPTLDTPNDILHTVYKFAKVNINEDFTFIVDMPPWLGIPKVNKKKEEEEAESREELKVWSAWLTAIELIKSGIIYDHSFNYLIIRPPKVVIFTKNQPPLSLLSSDRWILLDTESLAIKPIIKSQPTFISNIDKFINHEGEPQISIINNINSKELRVNQKINEEAEKKINYFEVPSDGNRRPPDFVDQPAEQKSEAIILNKSPEVNLQPILPSFSQSFDQDKVSELPIDKDAQHKKESLLPPQQSPAAIALTNLKAAKKISLRLVRTEETGFQSKVPPGASLADKKKIENLKKSSFFKGFSTEQLTDLKERFEVSKIREKREASLFKPDSPKKDG